jgi:hypothetical protein
LRDADRRISPFGSGVKRRVLASLTTIRLAAYPIHRNRERLVRLASNRAVRPASGREAAHDLGYRLHLVQRDGRPNAFAKCEQPPQCAAFAIEPLDRLGVFPKHLVATLPGRVLEEEHRLRIEQVQFSLAAPQVLTAHVEPAMGERGRDDWISPRVSGRDFAGEHVETNPAEPGGRTSEVLVDYVLGQSEGLEDLGADIGRDGGDGRLLLHL